MPTIFQLKIVFYINFIFNFPILRFLVEQAEKKVMIIDNNIRCFHANKKYFGSNNSYNYSVIV